jgi:hypothetical protein
MLSCANDGVTTTKTWISDNWGRARDMVRWFVLHAVPYIMKSLRLENTQGSLQSGMSGSVPTVEHWGGSVMVWAAISWYRFLLVTLLPVMAELVQESTWTGWVIRCIPWSRRYFQTTMRFSKKTKPPFIKLELFSHGLKNMKVNLNILPGQNNHHIWTSLWSVLENRLRNRFPPPPSVKKLEYVLQEEWYTIPLESAQNLYDSIPMTVAVLKVVQHHINKEICAVSVVFLLLCPARIYWYIPIIHLVRNTFWSVSPYLLVGWR